MSKKTTRVFGFPDIHWSDRDPGALAVAQAAHRAFRPDRTILMGDLLNCGPFSRHPKHKIDEDDQYDLLESELKPAAKFLDQVQRYTNQDTVVLEGNHDEWIERWIMRTAGGRGLQSLRPSVFLSRGRERFRFIPYSRLSGARLGGVRLGNRLLAIHGWAATKYAAKRHLDLAKPYSIIFGHTHRFDYRVESMADGNVVEAMSAGCLCKRIPIYAHNGCPTEWTHGFWVAYLGHRSFSLYPVPIKRGCAVLPDGKEIHA